VTHVAQKIDGGRNTERKVESTAVFLTIHYSTYPKSSDYLTGRISTTLNKQNIDVCGYTDPLLALEHFKDNYNKIDLVLSDIRMPQMNGYELANRIKALQPRVKVILMSAFEIREVEFSKMFHSVKIDSLISKPISMKNLRENSKCF
jgi:response regulator RpfG family c-di-GMP phosphodiesterase